MRRVVGGLALLVAAVLEIKAADLQCRIENDRIYCTYSLNRSDNQKGREVIFHWISPHTPEDDRIRHFQIPPLYGSVYDYRFLPGRAVGRWRVEVFDGESNTSLSATFEINTTDDSIFKEEY